MCARWHLRGRKMKVWWLVKNIRAVLEWGHIRIFSHILPLSENYTDIKASIYYHSVFCSLSYFNYDVCISHHDVLIMRFLWCLMCFLMGRDINPQFRDSTTTKLPSYLSLETLLSIIVIYISHEISSHSAYLLQLAPSPHATQLPGSQGSPLSTLSFSYGRTLPVFFPHCLACERASVLITFKSA